MLPKEKRLTTNGFNRFFGVGRRYHSEHFTLMHVPFPVTKAAVVVGKKVAKKAVERNRMRRRVYTVLGTLLADCGSGVYIVLVKKPLSERTHEELQAELAALFGRINN